MENNLILNEETKSDILKASRWAQFISIVGYVGVAIIFIGGLFTLLASFFYANLMQTGDELKYIIPSLAGIYIVLGLLYFFPVHFLYKMSSNLKKGILQNSQETINLGFKNMSNLFKYTGIMTIVILSLYALLVVGMIAFGALGASNVFSKHSPSNEVVDSAFYEDMEEELEVADSIQPITPLKSMSDSTK